MVDMVRLAEGRVNDASHLPSSSHRATNHTETPHARAYSYHDDASLSAFGTQRGIQIHNENLRFANYKYGMVNNYRNSHV